MPVNRRGLLRATVAGTGLFGMQSLLPAWAQTGTGGLKASPAALHGPDIELNVGHSPFTVAGRTGHAITVNGVLPAPLIRLREGQHVRLSVANGLDEDTSIHWHGFLLPFTMDGVPGISFPGIRGRRDLPLRIPDSSGGYLLVPQPFQSAGSHGALRPDHHRSRRGRSRWLTIGSTCWCCPTGASCTRTRSCGG